MQKLLAAFFTVLFFRSIAVAQLISVAPSFPKDAASISIIVDCSKGNQGLLNYGNTGDVYVHTGVITNLSSSSSDWKYVKFSNFNIGDPVVKAISLGADKYIAAFVNGFILNIRCIIIRKSNCKQASITIG